jgi:CBS domain-containing protein
MRVEQLMTRDVKACRADDTVSRAAQLMWEFDCGCVAVISANGDGGIVGVITDRDIAIAAYTQGLPLSTIPVSTAMASRVVCCHANDGISQAEALMRDHRVRRLPVLDKHERLAGIISINDIARETQREAGRSRKPEVGAEDLAATLAAICEPHTPRAVTVVA